MSLEQVKIKPQKIYLKDYQAPNFSVVTMDLTIQLFDTHALVDSILQVDYSGVGDIVLSGVDLELLTISINEVVLSAEQYEVTAEQLIIFPQLFAEAHSTAVDFPNKLTIALSVKNVPQKNRSLEGLYIAGEGDDTMFVTQCEPEGFRKITYFADRPDVLTEYTTRLEADKGFTTLLANGNLIEKGELTDNRHYTVWHDPTKKPSYLFACVFANLSVLSDSYTTTEGREVLLEIYTKKQDIAKCDLAMQALKDSMQWDEEHYGRCYDLDRYMIVAVSQFNMGAMENKGLNIFNTACVLSSPETTTDKRSFSVKAIIAHEYFHNWTGNRITCRDWFQLCLKEGFTVYRDQSFSACQQSPAVQRIDDVGLLRAHQFAEDASSLAHPVRPESFIEINNFYTTTIYEKGAEVVRMIANMMGAEKFRQGTDEYFKRHDGQAVTVEDFLDALNSADDRVNQFITWYRQPGTPSVTCTTDFDKDNGVLTIGLSQKTRHVAGYAKPIALPIPVACAVFNSVTGDLITEQTLMLTEDSSSYAIENVNVSEVPVVSVMRDFSAPVTLKMDYSATDLAFLIENETNGFNRWQATQNLVDEVLKDFALHLENTQTTVVAENSVTKTYLQAVDKALERLFETDPMLSARLLDIPSEREMATNIITNYHPTAVKQQHKKLIEDITDTLKHRFTTIYQQLPITTYEDTPNSRGVRALRNLCLDGMLSAGVSEANAWAVSQYENATCMTERLGALQSMVKYSHECSDKYLADFFKRFENEELVIDLWFILQASSESNTITDIENLMNHERFDWNTPNRVRAVLSSLANRPVDFWSEDGLNVYADAIQKLDEMNPVFAARLTQPLAKWSTLIPDLKTIAYKVINKLRNQVTSKNVIESLDNMLKAES